MSSFNSKLVRLNVAHADLRDLIVDEGFNSKLVPLKAKSLKTSEATTHRFNSKLVRLKEDLAH